MSIDFNIIGLLNPGCASTTIDHLLPHGPHVAHLIREKWRQVMLFAQVILEVVKLDWVVRVTLGPPSRTRIQDKFPFPIPDGRSTPYGAADGMLSGGGPLSFHQGQHAVTVHPFISTKGDAQYLGRGGHEVRLMDQ